MIKSFGFTNVVIFGIAALEGGATLTEPIPGNGLNLPCVVDEDGMLGMQW